MSEKMTKPPARERVVTECCTLIDEEVKAKGGFGGVVVKTAYGAVKGIKPGFVKGVVNDLLDEWVEKLEPFHADWQKNGKSGGFADYLQARKLEVAERLLEVTDSKAKHAKSGVVKSFYEKLRPTAKKHVEEAIPRLGRLVERQA